MTEIGQEPNLQNTAVANQALPIKPTLPPELEKKFNWGAFFFNWVWGVYHKYYWPLLIMVCIAIASIIISSVMMVSLQSGSDAAIEDVKNYIITTIILSAIAPAVLILSYQIWLGKRGNRIAWERRSWRDAEHFKSVQKKWGIVGLLFFVLAIGINLVVALLFTFGSRYINLEKNPTVADDRYREDVMGSYDVDESAALSDQEKRWLMQEFKNFRAVVDSEDGQTIADYLVASADVLIGEERFAENVEEYRDYNNAIFLGEKRHLTQDWKGGMPTYDEFASMIDDAIVMRYGTYFGSGEKNEMVYFETPQIAGKDFSWVLLFVVVPDEERIVFMTD